MDKQAVLEYLAERILILAETEVERRSNKADGLYKRTPGALRGEVEKIIDRLLHSRRLLDTTRED